MAIGHAVAYATARDAGVPQPLLDLYVCNVVRSNSAWFSELGGLKREQQQENETRALRAALPDLESYLERLAVKDYVRATILSDDIWKQSLQSFPHFRPDTTGVSPGPVLEARL